ncbi:MAG: hypothetical protein ACJ8FY_27000 [Gemmataceae bacterium]
MNSTSGRRKEWLPFFLLGAAFLASRLLFLPHPQPISDVFIYAQYVHEYESSRRQGMPFYELHARRIEAQAAEAMASGRLTGSLDEYKNVEYPPLSLLFMRFPELILGRPPPGHELSPIYANHYMTVFRAGQAAMDVALFMLLLACLRLWNGADTLGAPRLALYVLATVLLWHLLYDRLDLVLALLIVLALLLLASRVHYVWSFAVLALAVNFKLVPLVLAPIWILGSLSPEEMLGLARPDGLFLAARRSFLLLLLIVAIFLPFYLVAGQASLGFLAYHQARGLEIGSVFTSLPLMGHVLGHPIDVVYSFGSINVNTELAATLVRLVPAFAATALLAALLLLLSHCQGLAHQVKKDPTLSPLSPGLRGEGSGVRGPASSEQGVPPRLALLYPRIFAGYALLFLMLFILTNKVFSPQYLLWLAPLFALATFEGRTRRWLFGGFLLTCFLTTLLVPFLFLTDLYDPASQTVPRTFKEPTVRICALLIARNLVYVALTLGTGFALFTSARPVLTSERSQPLAGG